MRLAHVLGRVSTEATVGVNLANLHVEIGSFDRGLGRLAEVERLAEAAGLSHLRGTLLVIRGEVALALGELARARAQFSEARRVHIERGARREAAEADFHLADVALAAADVETARAHCAGGAAEARRLAATDLLAQASALEARCLLAAGEAARALPLLEAARERCGESSQELLAADVHAALARAHGALSDSVRSSEQRAAARHLLERIAETLPPALRAAFWAHPRRRELGPQTTMSFPPALSPTRHETPERAALLRFLEVNQRINSSLSVAQVLDFAMDAAIELAGAERGFVLLRRTPEAGGPARAAASAGPNGPSTPRRARGTTAHQRERTEAARESPEHEAYDVAVARNLDRTGVGREHYEFSRSIAERVLAGEGPIVTVDAQRDARFAHQGSVHAMHLQSVACVPIRSPKGVLGALYLDNRFERGRFSERDVDLLVAFAHQVAIALDNARMHAELERRTEELRLEKRAVERLSQGQAREIERLQHEVSTRQQALELRYAYDQIVGRSGPMRALLAKLDRIIDTPVTVLVQGESGTGKELVARAIHFNSPRASKRFVPVNCGAIVDTLFESELFGHKKGSFTGATTDKDGMFKVAHEGTIFLDEVSEIPLNLQVKLLRALEQKEITPVGTTDLLKVDVRIIAATNKDLRKEVEAGKFREDLFYRLNVVEVSLPPLSSRPDDIPLLASFFLEVYAKQTGKAIRGYTNEAMRVLLRHQWKGEVRELQNAVERAAIFCESEYIGPEHLPESMWSEGSVASPATTVAYGDQPLKEAVKDFERMFIQQALTRHHQNKDETARALGMSLSSLYRKIEELQITAGS
jgi:transcriptional regulator with GAF, ATPase, and Fis domain